MPEPGTTADMMANMILATAVLIGTVVTLVVVAVAWHLKSEEERVEREQAN